MTERLQRRDALRGEDGPAAYRALRDGRYGARLGFRFADGAMRSLPSTHLIETAYDAEIGVVLTFVGHRVTLEGRNLLDLYLRLEEDSVAEIHERHDFHGLALAEGEPWVERIAWEVI